MEKVILFISLLYLFVFFPLTAEEEKHINVMIFDVTASMIGWPDYDDEKNIFKDVKDIAYRIIDRYNDDTYLMIIPFGRGVQEDNIFEIHIRSDRERQRAKQFINDLEATEMFTWLTYSLKYGIDKLRELEGAIPDFNERAQEILLLTDGEGNGPDDRDEDGEFTVDNLIREQLIGKSDYPHLYTRFFAIGDILKPFHRERLEDAGISVTEIGTEELLDFYTVEVKPSQILVYDTHPLFNMLFDIDDPAATQLKVSATVRSEMADNAGSGFTISPGEFNLSHSQEFKVSVINKPSLERWMKQNSIQQINGFLSLKSEQDQIYFQPYDRVNFVYAFEPVNIKVFYEELLIKNHGDIEITFENPTNEIIEVIVAIDNVSNNIDHLAYGIIPGNIRVSGMETISLSLKPEDREILKEHRRQIKEIIEGNIILSITPVTANVKIDDESISIPVNITPDRLGPYILPLVIILLILILFVVWFMFIRPDFEYGDTLIYKDSVSESSFELLQHRKRRLFGNSVSVGIAQDIDIDLGDGNLLLMSQKAGVMAKVTSGSFEYETTEGKQTLVEGDKKDMGEVDFTLYYGDKQIIYKQLV